MAKLESKFQKELIDEIKRTYPGCIALKMTRGTYKDFRTGQFCIKTNGSYWKLKEMKVQSNSLIKSIIFLSWMICHMRHLFILKIKIEFFKNFLLYLEDKEKINEV